ncbi:CinA family protein [Chryseobacterium sp. 18068]|uniref:CinA family protein n=1 Tax=Chryseobacterium sp. 18068 TaxID=2681414 RepID=UPI00135C2244
MNWHEAEQHDCVSANISREMALNVAKSFKSQWSIAITGWNSGKRIRFHRSCLV